MRLAPRHLVALSALMIAGAADLYAQSAIYACGHIRRNRTQAITNLRNSGYTTAILFNVNVESDGTLTTDYDWNNQRPAEAGGIICQNGQYVFNEYQPYYVADIKSLMKEPTSINRIEICIGGWGNGSYGNIKKLVESDGTGEESILYKNFKALKETLPEIVAVNNDQEQDYDLSSAVKFHKMLAEIGYKTTVAPYTYKEYWEQLVSELNATTGTCDLIYLQTYGGGAANNPSDWKVFGDVPMFIGFDCEASADLGTMQSKFENWRNNDGVTGGFLWNYNSEARDHNEWATAINRVFDTKTAEQPVATFYQDINYGGYAISLPVGSFSQAELALYGLKARDISSLKIDNGYKVTLYLGSAMKGTKNSWSESTPYVGDPWNDKFRSLVIEPTDAGLNPVNETNQNIEIEISPDSQYISVKGSCRENISICDMTGIKIIEATPAPTGATFIGIDTLSDGIYIVRADNQSIKICKH